MVLMVMSETVMSAMLTNGDVKKVLLLVVVSLNARKSVVGMKLIDDNGVIRLL
jgi:hypothetical protein